MSLIFIIFQIHVSHQSWDEGAYCLSRIMEPFELTLSQVNFEEKDIASDQKLYSFNNIVSYESDFKKDEHEGIPILPRRFKDPGMKTIYCLLL